MMPLEAIKNLRVQIEAQGPDTPNRHYGRKQYEWLIECLDTLDAALAPVLKPKLDLLDLLAEVAEMEIEEMEVDELVPAWQTTDDIAARMRARLIDLDYWWRSNGS